MAQCPKHKVETLLSCGRCGQPVCPDCSVHGPAGIRCRPCAAFGSSPLYKVKADRLLLGFVVALLVAAGGSLTLDALRGLGFVLLLGGLGVGVAIAEVMLRSVNRKRGPKVNWATGLATTLGAAIGWSVWSVVISPDAWPGVQHFVAEHSYVIVAYVVMVMTAVGRVRWN